MRPSRWLWLVLGWGVLARGATGVRHSDGMLSIVPHETFTVVDLHPVRGQTLRALMDAELVRARAYRQTPFLELGGSGCGVCHALRQRVDARPQTPQVRRAFAGTYLIRIAVEEWPDAPATLGLSPDQRVPVYAAIDPAGHVTRLLNVDYWTLRNLDTDTLSTIGMFFRLLATPDKITRGVARLEADLASGRINRIIEDAVRDAGDMGDYRFVVATVGSLHAGTLA